MAKRCEPSFRASEWEWIVDALNVERQTNQPVRKFIYSLLAFEHEQRGSAAAARTHVAQLRHAAAANALGLSETALTPSELERLQGDAEHLSMRKVFAALQQSSDCAARQRAEQELATIV